MSTTVDQRVVEMRFDNQHFEKNVQTSMSTLEKFKRSLNLTGASKGLDDINSAAKRVDMTGLGQGIETVQSKFSALQVMGVTALANITNSAVNAGKRIVSALTIDPIKTGFSEYETQINAVQTILANTESKGSTLQDVNNALNELNTYADKTIYNFTEMTRNIGTFTAAGVDLDTSVSAIQGIANLAAVSGSTSQQASTAMYQLSQALATGTVKLMDWNSVVNAGMGGQVFQDALKQTARVHGVAIDSIIKKQGSFRESLSEGWLTTEILTETLNQFTMAAEEGSDEWETYKKSLMDSGYTEEQAKSILKMANTATDAATKVKTFTQLWDTLKESAQSGWTKSWEIMIGDFEEAKEFLTEISDRIGSMIGESADARNAMLSGGLSSGWKQLLNAGISDEEGFKDTFKSVAEEHNASIDDMIAAEKKLDESLTDTEAFQKALKKGFTEGKLSSDMLSESVHKMADKMSNMSAEELKAAGYTVDHVKQIKDLSNGLKDGSISMDEFVTKITRSSGRENIIQGLWNAFDGLMSVITPIKEAFSEIFPAMTGEQLYAITEKFREFTERLKVGETTANKIKSTFKGVFSVLDIGVEAFKAVAKGAFTLVGHLTGLGGGVLNATSSFGDFLTKMRDFVVEGNVFGRVVDKIVGFLAKGINKIKEFGSSLKDNMNISSTSQGFLGFFNGLLNVVVDIGSAIGDAFGSIGSIMSDAFGKGDIFEVINSGLFAGILLAIRNFISGLSDPIEKISIFERLDKIVGNVTGILNNVKDSLTAYQKDIQANTLLKIAGAVGILAVALYVISGIDSDKLAASLGSIGVMMGELIGAMALMNKLNSSSTKPLSGIVNSLANISRTIQMIGLTVAVVILAGAMKILAGLDWEGIGKGLAGVAGLVVILVAAAKLMDGNSKSITKFAGQMVIMSVAIGVLSLVAKYLSSMSWEELGKAGAGILGIVVMLVGAAKIMDSDSKSITKFAGQMVIMSVAIAILAKVGKNISSMSWEELGKAGAGILGLVIMLVAAAKIMDSDSKSITKFGVQMLLMSASLAVMVPVLKSLGSMSWESIGKGLVAIGGALLELGIGLKMMSGTLSGSAALLVAAVALKMIVPTMQTLGSMSWESIGKGLLILAAAFTVVGVAGYLLSSIIGTILVLAGAFTLFGIATLGIGAGMMLIAAGFTALATAGVAGATAFVAALNIIITGVLKLIPTIAKVIGEGIVEIAKVIGDYAPQLGESFLKLILGIIESLETYTPKIVDSLLNFFIGVLNSLADHMPKLLQAAMNFIGAFFQGIVDALNGIDTGNLLKGVIAVGIMTALMYALSSVVALIPSAMLGMLGIGAVIAEMAIVIAAIGGLAQIPGLDWLITEGGNFLEKVGTAIGQFVGGIVGGAMQGISSSLPQIAADLSSFMENIIPFVDGAKNIDPSMMEGVQALAKTVLLLTAADFLDGILSFIPGGSSLSNFAKQLVPFGEGMKAYGEAVSGVDSASITASATAAKALTEVANAIPLEGGLWGLLAGDKDLGSFGEKLVPFGEGMKSYAEAVTGLNGESITASAAAANAIVQVANAIPVEGGFWQLLAGERDLASFGEKLIPFGLGMKTYATAIAGIDTASIIASATAAQAIVAVANAIPSEGGFWSLIDGEKDLASFGQKLTPFGEGMKSYASAVTGIDTASIIASTAAANAIISVANAIPSEGGFWSLIDGDKDLASFSAKLIPFGLGMKTYATAIAGIDTASIIASTAAAHAIVSVANAIPSEGGFWSLIDGDKNLASFGQKLTPFGEGMKTYAAAVADIDTASIIASTVAAKSIVSVANAIPSEGGFWSLIDGDKDLGSFGEKLTPFGEGMKSYATSVAGIDTEAIVASSNAAKAIVTVAKAIPTEGGIWGLIKGDKDLSSFGEKLAPFGKAMKKYSNSVTGLNTEAINTSVSAAKSMVKVAKAIPKDLSVGVASDTITSLGNKLKHFGEAMKSYASSVAGVNVGIINNSVNAAQSVVKLIKSMDNIKTDGVSSFKSALNQLATVNISSIAKTFSGASTKLASSGSKMMDGLLKGMKSKQGSLTSGVNSILSAMNNTVNAKVSIFIKAGNTLITKLASGMTAKKNAVTSAISSCLSGASRKIRSYYSSFYNAGSYLVTGFASGISANTFKAEAEAKAMADAAEKAAKAKLDINSPSKVFRRIGSSVPEGFAMGIAKLGSKVKAASVGMTDTALDGVKGAISKIAEAVNTDIDSQPVIRPVLDMSDIQAGVGSINGLFSMTPSVGMMSNVRAINSMMNRNQNGGNDDVVSAIDKLRKDLGNIGGNSYNINGITYDDGSNVSEAIKTLVRATRVERRI